VHPRRHLPYTIRHTWLAVLLAGAVAGVYRQVATHGFIAFDDPGYVTQNSHVLAGLTLEGVRWAFSTGHMGNWNPLTWLSHMLDVQLFGLHPGAHHLVNLAFHLANTLLLFGMLQQATRAPWPSFVVASLFGVHPLHVESVAWVAERKDVLSTFFWFLTLWGYIRYARTGSGWWYGVTLALFALGLLAKPMLVTVPFGLLLLDLWPLGRLALPGGGPVAQPDSACRPTPLAALFWEKLPFLALAVIAAAITYTMQLEVGAIDQSGLFPIGLRLANALVAYVRYLAMAVWPVDLALIYPYARLPPWQPVGAALGLTVVSVLVARHARLHPYLLVGWLWYLGTLVPVIGLVQIGSQAFADRYTYVPLVGVFVMVAWGGRSLCQRWTVSAPVAATLATAVIAAYAVAAWAQVGLWVTGETLLRHTVRVTRDNCIAYNSLGATLMAQGEIDAAMEQFREALRIKPDYPEARYNLATALYGSGRLEEAIAQYEQALRVRPGYAEAHSNLANALRTSGRLPEAIAHFQEALRLKPDSAEVLSNLGMALRAAGRLPEAIAWYEQALRLNPGYVNAHNNLGNALRDSRRLPEAIEHYQEALRLDPDSPPVHNNLGNALRDSGRLAEAIDHYQRALQLRPDFADAQNNLADARARAGRAPQDGAP